MEEQAERFICVGPLAELRAKGRAVVSGRHCPILVICDGDSVRALDNRCPHMGFPLHRGTVDDGILTCHWHHARFDIASGNTFDLWADDIPVFDVEVRDGEVWVGVDAGARYDAAHWRDRLRDGMTHNLALVIAKSILGSLSLGVAPARLVEDAALFGVRQRDGWSVGLSILTALANVVDDLPEEERFLALLHGIRRVAADCDGEAPRPERRPLDAPTDPDTLERWLRQWVLVRHRTGAERTLLTAIAGGVPPPHLARMLLTAATDRCFADGGHALDFVNKAFECLDVIGWSHAHTVLPSVLGGLVGARGAEESDSWRHPVDLISLMDAARAEMPARIAKGAGKRGSFAAHAALADIVLGDDPAAIMDAVLAAIGEGAAAADLGKALCYAAALRIARFGTTNEFSDWDTALHAFTYANAVHQALKRVSGANGVAGVVEADLLRAVLHGAMAVYLCRYLNVPPAPLPGERGAALEDFPSDKGALLDGLLDCFDRQQQVEAAAHLVARYLERGHPPRDLIAALALGLLREDAGFHTYQMFETGVRQFHEWGISEEGRNILVATARYLAAHAPTERALYQTASIASRLHRGGAIHEAD